MLKWKRSFVRKEGIIRQELVLTLDRYTIKFPLLLQWHGCLCFGRLWMVKRYTQTLVPFQPPTNAILTSRIVMSALYTLILKHVFSYCFIYMYRRQYTLHIGVLCSQKTRNMLHVLFIGLQWHLINTKNGLFVSIMFLHQLVDSFADWLLPYLKLCIAGRNRCYKLYIYT